MTNNLISILLIGYNRPEFMQKRLNEIASFANSNYEIQIIIDGPTSQSKYENSKIRKLIKEEKRFDFNVSYRESNLGLARNIVKSIDEKFSSCSNLLVFEDDIRITEYAVNEIHNALLKVSSQEIATVGGFGIFPSTKHSNLITGKNKFRITPYFSAWGWGIKREVWQDYQINIPRFQWENKLSNSKTFRSLNDNQQNVWKSRFTRVINNESWTWDLQMQYMSFITDRHHLLPRYRLVENEGFSDLRSTNTKNRVPRWYFGYKSKQLEIPFSKKISYSKFFVFLDSISFVGDRKITRK